jgi:hypothetical protein
VNDINEIDSSKPKRLGKNVPKSVEHSISVTNLNYNPNKYVYSGSREEKKKLIREGRLPSASDVIRSDLDARDLV